MSLLGAVVAGFVATAVFYVITRLTTMNLMGWERYLATVVTERTSSATGFVLLFASGVAISLCYAALWSLGIGWPSYLYGLIFGIIQWLIAGLVAGALPAFHVGIRAGVIRSPGLYMTNLLGRGAFVAGLVNHVIYGLAVAYFYQFFVSRYTLP